MGIPQYRDVIEGLTFDQQVDSIVALARKLAIALWRYVELGLVPQGATLSSR